jgi:hypothetical protein
MNFTSVGFLDDILLESTDGNEVNIVDAQIVVEIIPATAADPDLEFLFPALFADLDKNTTRHG